MVDHTRRGIPTAGRGTGFCGTLTRVSAAVTAARAAVPNFVDDGAGAFENEARMSADLAVVVCRRALAEEGVCSPGRVASCP